MTFEKAYKEWLKTELPDYLSDYNLYVSNDISYKPLEKDSNGILCVINSGVGSRLLIEGGDYTTLTFNINFVFDANKLQDVLSSLNELINDYNAKYDTIEIGVLSVRYKPIFTNPYAMGGLFELSTKNENNQSISMKCVNVILNINVAYSSNIDFEPSVFKMIIGTTEYTISGIESYDFTSAPIYDTSQQLSLGFANQDKLANVIQFHFKIVVIKNNTLHGLFTSDFFKTSAFISDNATLKLKKDSGTAIDIKTVVISEIWDKGVKIIDLTLGR